VIAALGGLIWWSMDRGRSAETAEVVIAGETFALDIAADRATIEKGLMWVEEIDPHGGMIFVLPPRYRPNFWMKNCVVDIDLLYLDGQRRVIGIYRMQAQSPKASDESDEQYEARIRETASYASDDQAAFAVELKAGTIDRLGLAEGDRLEFDHLALKRMAR